MNVKPRYFDKPGQRTCCASHGLQKRSGVYSYDVLRDLFGEILWLVSNIYQSVRMIWTSLNSQCWRLHHFVTYAWLFSSLHDALADFAWTTVLWYSKLYEHTLVFSSKRLSKMYRVEVITNQRIKWTIPEWSSHRFLAVENIRNHLRGFLWKHGIEWTTVMVCGICWFWTWYSKLLLVEHFPFRKSQHGKKR